MNQRPRAIHQADHWTNPDDMIPRVGGFGEPRVNPDPPMARRYLDAAPFAFRARVNITRQSLVDGIPAGEVQEIHGMIVLRQAQEELRRGKIE